MADRLLVVNADDFGLTEGVSTAILEAHRSGVVTATSVLGNGPATRVSLDRLVDHTDLEIGLHGALVGEDPPVLTAVEIPTLVDRRGRLAASWRALLPRLVAGRVDMDDVRRELEAQLLVVSGAGAPVTHANLHQHLQLWPPVGAVLVELAAAHGIGYVRVPSSGGRGPKGRGIQRLTRSLRQAVADGHLNNNDGFLGLDEAGTWTGDDLRMAIGRASGSVVEANVHPGPLDDPDRDRYRWDYRWSDELDALLDPRTAQAVTEAGFTLAGPSAMITP